MAKKLEIIGLFNNSQIRRAFGDMIADTTRAKNTWTEMTTKMKTTEAEISSEIKKNIATIKEKEKAIDSLHRKMNNPMNSSFSSKYQKEISDIDKSIAAYKRYNKELENTAKTERMMSYKQMGGNVAGAAGKVGLGVLGVGVAAGAMGLAALQSYMPVDQQLALLDATLRPKSQGTKDQVRNQVFGASSTYGKDAAEVGAAYTQLFSSGLAPTAKEGTSAYTQQIDEAGQVLNELAKASAATGESMTSMQSALVYTANAFGKDIHNIADVKSIFDAMGVTLDLGIGTMSQYSSEFSKFAPAAKSAGASMKDSMAVFALMTQSYGAAEAGNATKQLFEETANSGRYMSRAQNVLNRMKKGDLVVGTDSDKSILSKFANKSTGAKALDSYFVDSKGNNKPLVETLKEVNQTYKSLNSDSAKNAFISAIGAMNSNMIKTWRVMTGQTVINTDGKEVKGTGVDKLEKFIAAYDQQGVMDAKIEEVNAHMSQKMAVMGQSWKNGMYSFIAAAEPTISSMIDFLTRAAGLLGPIGERINYALGGLTQKEQDAENKRKADELARLDTSGNVPAMATQFAPGITGSLPYGEMHKLFDPNSGMDEKKIQDSLFFGKGDVSKEDIMKAYGKNAPQALDLVTKNLGEANGVWSWATVGLSRMAGNQGQDVNQYIAELQNLSTIIAEKNKLLEKQQADANTELRSQTNYLQIIAGKNFGGATGANIFSARGAGLKGGAIPGLSNPMQNFLAGFQK